MPIPWSRLPKTFCCTRLRSFIAILCVLCAAIAGAQTTLTPGTLGFGNIVVGQTSAVKTTTLKNTQTVTLAIFSIATSGTPFAVDPSTTCGSSLAAGATCKIGVTFSPTTVGAGQAGTLTITTDATNNPQTVALTGTGVAQATLTPASVAFGSVAAGTMSASKALTLTNNQTSTSLAISAAIFTGAFQLDTSSNTSCPMAGGTVSGSLAAASSCTIAIIFNPTTTGAMTGTVTVDLNATTGDVSSNLSGTGIVPTKLSATKVAFGSEAVNETSAIKTVTLTNNQSSAYPLTFTSLVISGDSQFLLDPSTTCSTTAPLAGGGTCTLAFTFTPTSIGAQPNGTLTIYDSANDSPQTITLTGSGVAQTTLTPTTYNFGSVIIDTTSATKTLTLKNNQAGTLNIASLSFTGPFALDTSPTTTCPMAGGTVSGSLAGGATCVIGVTFDPTVVGATSGGAVTVVDDAPGGDISSSLSGTGINPITLSVSAENFGNQAVGTTSAARNITITNKSTTTAVALNSVTASAGFTVTDPTCTIPGSLAAGTACTITVAFDPTTPGAQTGTLSIYDSAVTNPQTVSLSGTGTEPPVLSSTSVNFGSVTDGTSATATVTYTNYLAGTLTVRSAVLSPTGTAFAVAPATTCPSGTAGGTIASQTSCQYVFSFSPTTSGLQSATFTIKTNASNSPQTVTLSGTGSSTSALQITTSSLPNGEVGVPYSQTLTATGGSAPYTWTVIAGVVPTGTLFTTAGALSGTPAVTGTYNFTVQVTDSLGATASQSYTVVINPGPTITSTTLPNGDVGTAYSQTLTATGGSAPYTWTVIAGVVPTGTLFTTAGALSGTPTVAGPFTFTMQVMDSLGATASQAYTVVINPALTITTTTLPNWDVGVAGYSQTVTATGGSGSDTWSATGSLPTGLTLTPSTGVLAGTPTAAGPYTFTLKVTDSLGGTASQAFTVVINPALTITTTTLPNGDVGSAYSQTLVATGGTGSDTWSATGSLPTGLTLTPSTGLLSGTPTATGSYTFTAKVTDTVGGTASQTYTVTINPALTITSTTLPNGEVGAAYSQTLVATGGASPYSWTVIVGIIPTGLVLTPGTNVLSGTPTVTGTYNFTVQVTDSLGSKAAQAYTVVINPALTITTTTLLNEDVGSAYSQTLVATGGTAPYTWAVIAGGIPTGTLFSTSGALSGTPTVAGPYTFTLKVTDSLGGTASQAFTVVINPALTITNAILANGDVGSAYSQTPVATGGTGSDTWSATGSLPAGLTLTSSTGALSGTPTVAGPFTFTVQVTDTVGGTASQTYTVTINPALTITTTTLPNWDAGFAGYSQALMVTGGATPYTWADILGAIPTGTSLTTAGVLSGTPTVAGTSNFTVQVTDSLGGTASQAFTVLINPALTITTTTLPNGDVGSAYSQTLASTGGTGSDTWSATGSLPTGLTLTPSTGVLAGTPTLAGTYNFTVQVTDSIGGTASQAFTVIINTSNPVTLSTTSLVFGNVAVGIPSASQTITLTSNQSSALTINSITLPNSSYTFSSGTTCPYMTAGVLPGLGSCDLVVTFIPTTTGPLNGPLTINISGISAQTVTLNGTGVIADTVSPTALAFGNVVVNTKSPVQSVTLTNNQSAAETINSITAPTGGYAIDPSTTCSTTLPGGASCTVAVTLTPTSVGPVPAGNLIINTSASSNPLPALQVSLTGAGIAATTLSTTSVNFGNVAENQKSPVQNITLTNNQTVTLNINSIALSGAGGFALAPTTAPYTQCTYSGMSSLAAGGTCAIGVTLTPTVVGSVPQGTLTIVSDAGGTQLVNLNGAGVVPVIASPSTLTFPSQFQGTKSASQTVTVNNQQTASVTFSGISITGPNAGDFAVVTPNTCTGTLAGGASCSLTVTFTPTASGTETATLNINDTLSDPSVTLTGTGSAPVTVSPTSITSFTAPVGTTSSYQTITITNNDTVNSLSLSSLQFTGDFSQSTTTGGTNLCSTPSTLGPGASCNVAVQFGPTIGGTRNGQLAIYDGAATSPQVVNLSGTGTSPLTLSSSLLNFSAQTLGTSSSPQHITLTNHEVQSETFSLAASANFMATSNCNNGTIAANSSCNLTVVFAPSITTPAGPVSGSLTVTNSAPSGSPLSVVLNGSATTTPPAAAVAVVSPGAGSAGTTVNVVITGNTYTHFTGSSASPATSSSISFTDADGGAIASEITVQSFMAVSANQINATLVLAGGAGPVYGATNISVASPLSGGGTETAQLNSAFVIADPSNAHSIVSVTPAFGTQGQTLDVALTAVGTHFVQDTTYANFGDGVTVNSLLIIDSTDAQANITISNTTPVGYRTITLVTGGEFATSVISPSGNPIFQIGPSDASLVSVTPNTSGQSVSLPVTIVGLNTNWLQNATQFSFTGGILVGNVQVNTPTNATVQLAVPANATPGLQNVTVATGGEIATLPNAFSVISTTPYLTSVNPGSAKQGQQNVNVEIQGANTNFSTVSPANVIADFTGEITVNTITVNSASDVVVNISVSPVANVGAITARLTSIDASGNATIFPFTFNVTGSGASIVSVTPNSVPQGGQVTLSITGLNTIWNQATTTAAFYPEPVPIPIVNEINVTDATDATLNITVPANTPPGSYAFYMATGGQVVSSSINVYANTPSLVMSPANGLVPSSGTSSFSVSFTGQFTHFTQTGTVPVIAGEGVTLTNFTVNSLVSATGTVTIAAGAATGPRLVTFTTGEEIVTTYFNVTSTPIGIISVLPYHAPQNDTLNVAITGLNTHFAAGSTTVLFGPQITVNSVTVNDATDLIVNITTNYSNYGVATATPPGWQAVYVNTGAEQLITGFSVDPPGSPSLLSVMPSSAAQGSTVDVTITGSLTNWVQGTTEAILGAGVTVANLHITSPTTATATIAVSPTAPVGGNSVIMITGSEIVSGIGFSVTPSAAYIASVTSCNPTLANLINCGGGSSVPVVSQLQTVTLYVTGIGTHWLQGETTLNFGPGVVVDQLIINSPTTATAQITVLSSSPVGFAALAANTDGEIASLQQAIDIEQGFPTLLAISPGAGEQGATFTLQVLGRFTHFTSAPPVLEFTPPGVTGITVNSVNVIDDDNLTANVTVEPWAYVDYSNPCGHVLTVTTGDEQISTAPILDNFCVTQGAAQINSISSLAGAQGTTATVTITGSRTNFLQGVTQVSFGDPNFQVGQITVNSPTSVTASVAIATSATPGYKTVTVTTYGEVATQQYAFTVTPDQPTLTEANPYQAEQGAQDMNVVLTGQYTHFDANSTATFGAGIIVNSVTLDSATQLTVNISIDPLSYVGGRTVTVTTADVPCADQPPNFTYQGCAPGQTTGNGKEIVSDSAFNIVAGPAIITHAMPNTGNEGQEVVFNITGANTHWQQNFTQFYIAGGGFDITVNDVIINSPTSATVDMNISPTANPGARSIYMVTAGESLTDSGAFVVTGGVPVVTYLSPNSAVQGTSQLQVTINGLYTNWTTGATTINFGPGITVSSYQVDDATHIEAVINVDPVAQPGYRTVVVATGTQGLTGNFLVTAPPPPPTPYIWYESPSSGIPGQTLTINFTGINTEWNPDPVTGTQLTGWDANNITVNTFQITSPTTARANITINPSAPAETMGLTFTTPGTASYGTEVDNARFTIVIAQPVLSIVDPGSGMQGAGLNGTMPITVNIIGQFTAFDSTTTFSFGPGITLNGPPTILGPTIATQSITIGQETPTGGYPVVATTPDAPAIAQVVGGAYFTVTPSLAMISAITPNTAQQGSTITNVDVTGSNTHWNGSTVFQFGAGITVTNATVNSETDATLTLTVPPLAPEGPTNASATTGGEIANINNGFVVTAGTPLLLSSGPGSLPQQSSAIFTILSQQTHWDAIPPTVSYGAGVVVTNINVTGPTSMTVEGYVQPTTNIGYRNLTVISGTQELSLPNALYVRSGPAVINSVSPSSGGQGVNLPAVQINGTNTNWQQGVTSLSFPDVLVNSFTVNSLTSITANVTVDTNANPGQVSVTATTGGEVATEVNAFTVVQTQPELLAVVASSGAQGQTENVVLTGLYTHFSSTSVVSFGPGITVNSINATSNTSITANITVQPTTTTGYRNVSIASEGGIENVALTNGFRVTTGPAAILSLSPASGAQDTSLTVLVTGSQTNFTSGVTAAVFYGGISVTGISVIDSLHANVTLSIPSTTAVGSYDVSMVTGGEVATILGGFTVTSGSAQLSSVAPPTGTQGTTNLNVTLTGLFTHFVNGTSVASFGSSDITVNSTTVTNSTTAVANITISNTAALGSRNVTVTTGAEVAGITGGFTVLVGVPALTSASPATGQAGDTINVVINGAFTTFQQGFSSVTFGDGITTNFVTVTNLTQLTANITIPSNASVGNTYISVTTNSQTLTLNNAFAVTAGTPVITVINPNIGNPGQTLSVTITGRYTNWVNGTTTLSFGASSGITVNSVTVNSATNLTANISISSSAPVGPVSVITTTGPEVENVPGGFTIQPVTPPSPTLLSLSPGANAGGMPLNSFITAVFSEPMLRSTINTSTVLLYLTSNPGQGNIPVTGTVNLDATGRVLTFTPSSLLAVNSTYYLELTSGIQSATGVSFSNYDVDLYTNANAATTAPTVIAANPPANSTVGTNVAIQLEFSGDMDQDTQSGMTLSIGSTPVAGTYSWNAPVNCCSWGPGTILTFTPSAPLAPGTLYTVAWTSAMTDTAGNALTPGSFTFTTGSGPDTVTNNPSVNFSNLSNVGTNFAPVVTYLKYINPIDINTGTLLMYNADSGKYVGGLVTVAPNGLSATFTPSVPLLPDTYYRVYQAGGYYDADGNYLNGANWYFTTGSGEDLTPPSVASMSPADGAANVPLNSEIIVHFSSPISSNNTNVITVTPSGGSAITGTATLESDQVTLIFVPASGLQGGTTYTIQVSGYSDVVGNMGSTFTSSFTTSNSPLAINVSTGFNAAGQLITTNGAADGHWTVVPTASTPTPPDTVFSASGTAQPLYVVGPGDTGWYSGWVANGPNSDWVNINPTSTTSNTHGVYSTTFNIPGPTLPSNLCLVGAMGVDDNGELGLNGVSIMGNISAYGSLAPINIPISSYLVVGSNTLSLAWGTTDNSYEAFRLQGVIQTCGDSLTGGLTLASATPSNGATGVATNTTITMNFNNPLDPATVNSTTLPVMVGWNSNQELAGSYAVTGNQVIFTPDSPFPTSTTIWVGACNGPLDLAGDSAGNCYTQLMSFTTGATGTPAPTPLQVIAFSPAANATNVGLRSPITATFNRSINLNTINTSDFGLFQGDGQSPWCDTYSHSQDDATVSFNCYPLPSSTTMTAILNRGITDWQGNALTNFSNQFTTSQYDSSTNGTIISTRPGNGASGVNANSPITLYSNLPLVASGASNGVQVAENNVLVPGVAQVIDNGYTLEFTPNSPFTPGALIQWWTTGSLSESTYNTPVTATSGYFFVSSSTATLAPTVQVASPPAYTNPVPTNSIFDVQFNTPLNPSTVTAANIYLYDGSTGLNVPMTQSQPQPNEVLMVPSSALPANHYIYVEIKSGLQSATSVPATATNWYEYTGTTSDTTLPMVVSAVPYNGAGGIGVNATPGVVFNKTIDPVSVNSNTFQILDGGTPLAGVFSLNSTDTRVQFVPYAPLPASTNLTLKINGILDQVGNPITFNSTFQTAAGPDFTAPTVVWSSVVNDGSIPINSMITVQFSESMDVTTFSPTSNFRIYDTVLGTTVAATLSWNSSQTVFYLLPNSPLAAGRTYYLYVNGGTDLAGNAMQNISPTFYAELTAASTAPTVINFNPISGQTVGTNAIVEAQFSGPIDPNTLSGVTLSAGGSPVATSPSLSAGNTVLQLVPAVPLNPNTTYTMTISGVKDPAGNLVTTVNNSFTTGATYDITAASVTISDPPSGTTVGTNVIPKMVFNKPLNPITVTNSTFQMYLVDTGQFIPLVVTPSANGLEVTMTPQVALLPNTYYRFEACCGYQDQDGNNGNSTTLYFYTDGGANTTGPTVTVNPLQGATSIPLNAQVTATLSVPMDPTSWTQNSIQVLNGTTPVAGTVSMTNNQTLTFVASANLIANTTYTINVSTFTDANGNPVVPHTGTFTTGTAAGTGGLTLVSTNITNGSTGVSNTQPIILTFSQILDPNTVNSSTLKVMNTWNSNQGIAGTYSFPNPNQVEFMPASPYPAGAIIYMGACGGPTDVLGDVFRNGACYDDQFLYFTVSTATETPIPFQVMSVSPANGATNVGRDQPVSVTFNNSILNGSASNYNSQLYAGQELQVAGSYTLSADNRTLTFNIGALSNSSDYTISFPAGGISDMAGNKLATTFTSTFSTVADPATGEGSVTSTAPGANATGVPTNSLLTLYLNREANAATVANSLAVTVNGAVYPGTVAPDASGYEVQYTPNTAFPNGATVQWFFSGASDIYGNAFTDDSGVFYTAAAINLATAQPLVVAFSPGYGATNVATNAKIDIQYSQPIDASTLSGNVYQYSGPATPYTVSLISPTVVRIAPTTVWYASATYYFCVNSSVKGTNGVAAQGDCYFTYFTTASGSDTSSGTVTVGPPNGVMNVGTNAYIRLQFSKPADRTTVNSTNVPVTAGGNLVSGSWTYNYNGSDLMGANFYPLNPLPPSTSIQVAVSNILDYAGNLFNQPTVNFTTAAQPDYTTPSVSLDFGNGATGIATNASFTCRYSEPMDPSSITPVGTYVYSYVTSARIPVTYNISSDWMSVTMTPVTPLFADSNYYYSCQSAIDLTGNAQSGSSSSFYTGNTSVSTGPQLLQINPPNGMTNVPLNTNNGPWLSSSLGMLFNEPVSANSLGQITLTPQGGSAIPISTAVEDGNFIVWVQLPYALQPNTTYTYNIAGVTDLNGNAMTPVTSTFTTGSSFDFTNPTAASAVPANNATNVSVNTPLSITFSEAMDPVLVSSANIYLRTHNTQTTVPTTFSISSDFTTISLTPIAPLSPSTIYDLVYWPNGFYMYDIAGNYAPNYGVASTFTTGTATPENGSCGSANGGIFAMPPNTNLCSVGTPSSVTNPGSWSWSCNGLYGGTNASCSASVSYANSCTPQQPGLVGWWSGNDTANDLIGGNNGTLENGATFGLGEVGNAFSFNGNNQYVLIGQPVPANLQVQNSMTLSAWIYPTAYPTTNGTSSGGQTWGLIVGSQTNAHTGAALLLNGYQNVGITGVPIGAIEFDLGDGSAWHEAITTTQVPVNQWTLVTATATANNPMQVYFNGVAQATLNNGTTPWTGTVSYSGDWFAIGQDSQNNWPFNGLIDEVQAYNTALSAAQIQSLYQAGSVGMCQVQTPTTTTVSSSSNPAFIGAPVTLTATISPSAATGTVTFMDGTTALGTAAVSGGQAQFSTSSLNLGTHTISALYGGDSTYSGSASASLMQSIIPTGACDPQPSGLIDWWPGENNTNDIIGSNNGTAEGTVSYAAGEVGEAFSFSAGDVSVSMPSLNTTSGQITVSFWMNWNGTNGVMPFGFYLYDLYLYNGTFGFNTGNGDVWGISSSGLTNNWVQVTAVFTNGDPHSNQLYINGVQQTLSQQVGSTPHSASVVTSAAKVGGWTYNTNYRFTGLIDEVQVYNGTLSAAQVLAIYNAGSVGVCH